METNFSCVWLLFWDNQRLMVVICFLPTCLFWESRLHLCVSRFSECYYLLFIIYWYSIIHAFALIRYEPDLQPVFNYIEVAENCGERAALYRDLRIPAHDEHVLQTREARTGIECLQLCTANFPSCISAYHNDKGVKMEHIFTSLTFISQCCFFLFVQSRSNRRLLHGGLLLFASHLQRKSVSNSHRLTTLSSINLCLMSWITIRPAVFVLMHHLLM